MKSLLDLLPLSNAELALLAYDQYPTAYARLTAECERDVLLNHVVRAMGYRWPTASQSNPFGYRGCIRQLDRYLVRWPVTRHLFDELRRGNSVSIVGESQTGKSSLLWYLEAHGAEQLNQPNLSIVSLNLEEVETVDDFYEDLYDLLGLDPQRIKPRRLMRHLRQTDRRIILCLDEVERLTVLDDFVRSNLRTMIDGTDAPLSLVTASRTPLKDLFPETQGKTSPIYSLCHRLDLKNFSLAETFALLEQRLSPRTALPPRQVMQAWQKTQGHPMRLQQELRQLFRNGKL